MKKIIKSLVTPILAILARAVLRRYHPRVVMVTGSVGKTSTKDAVAAVLTSRFLVRKSEKSFNSELGVPFTVLGVQNPWGNPLAWLLVVKHAIGLLLLPNHYPNMLVLEVGSDKPGDLAQILKIVTPDMVVVTRLPEIPVHVEAYASPEAVREEEFSPAYALDAGAPLLVCADDSYACAMAARIPARVIRYGVGETAAVRASSATFYSEEGRVAGMQTNVTVGADQQAVIVKGSVGATQIMPVTAAIAAAHALDISLADACTALEAYEPPPGRCRLLNGKNDSLVIDDSYNSSPAAAEEALATLKSIPGAKRRIAVLGDMLELGRYSVAEHERIGEIAAHSADLIVTVGIRARAFMKGAAHAVQYENSRMAAQELPNLIQPGDVVLVKGSQSVRMERVVEALLADPADSSKLVRQEHEWKRKA